jgi:hypothetical protein
MSSARILARPHRSKGRRATESGRPLSFSGLGVLVVLVSTLADVLGIGGEPGFGYKQGVGVLVGIALIIAGVWWTLRR